MIGSYSEIMNWIHNELCDSLHGMAGYNVNCLKQFIRWSLCVCVCVCVCVCLDAIYTIASVDNKWWTRGYNCLKKNIMHVHVCTV